jgi:hypothetical protein
LAIYVKTSRLHIIDQQQVANQFIFTKLTLRGLDQPFYFVNGEVGDYLFNEGLPVFNGCPKVNDKFIDINNGLDLKLKGFILKDKATSVEILGYCQEFVGYVVEFKA